VTPDSDSPEAPDRMPRPSRRALALGAAGVLLAGAVVAAAGFLAGGANAERIPPEGARVNTQHGQLDTFSLHDEKPMKAIGKGVPEKTSPTATPTSTP
jgi:ferric-dicitrate binding protein FerR (iron transport regulator)